MLRDSDQRKVAQGSTVVAPAQTLRWIGVAPITGELRSDGEAGIRPRHRVRQRLDILNGTKREVSFRFKPVRVYKDEPELPHQLRVFESSKRRIGLGHKQGILLWQVGDEIGIYR